MRVKRNAWSIPVVIAGTNLLQVPGYLHLASEGHIDLSPYLLAAIILLPCVVINSLKWPECMWPGKFDKFGNSHNAMNFGVLFAAFTVCYAGLRSFHEVQISQAC